MVDLHVQSINDYGYIPISLTDTVPAIPSVLFGAVFCGSGQWLVHILLFSPFFFPHTRKKTSISGEFSEQVSVLIHDIPLARHSKCVSLTCGCGVSERGNTAGLTTGGVVCSLSTCSELRRAPISDGTPLPSAVCHVIHAVECRPWFYGPKANL